MIRWGIIGCGDVCEIKSGPAFYKSENSSLVAVMRRNHEKARDFALRHRVPKYYSDADELIRDSDVDIVYIATPPAYHAELAIKVLKAGKPVYVEKPMAVSFRECSDMIDAAKKYKQKLFVAYYRRSLPYFLKVKELLDKKTIGKVLYVKMEFSRPPLPSDLHKDNQTWRLDKKIAGGGYFYDMASHTIDILLFLLGKISKVNGLTSNVGGFYKIEDTVSASFLFQSGVLASGIWAYSSPVQQEKDEIIIIGEKGTISFSTFSLNDIELEIDGKVISYAFPKPKHIQMNMIQNIINELNGIGKSPSTGETASETNRIMNEIFKNK
ncbi:MAG: Gfo/Idh/MocA family oxidoreductase [Dysgonamonadaceae bacterium]|jgi:predicted dehydrogenase|nr:Gfo/Idh/MocA family oxidoreductase [Dysgonamonadaceae bacterium]